MQYSNPTMTLTVNDWPYGQYRTTATFLVETHPTRGERGTRTTVDPKTGRTSKPKVLTFGRHARIVQGDDGRTYILVATGGHLSVMQSNMQFQQEAIFPSDARYGALLKMVTEGTTP
jgi:hypothetical protein